jgi:hypothetical protein
MMNVKQNHTNEYLNEQKIGSSMLLILGTLVSFVITISIVLPHLPH